MHDTVSPSADGARSAANSRGCGDTLAASASALRRATNEGRVEPLLRGKYFGLICEQQDSEAAELFYAAAVALGAQVARIRPSIARLDGRHDAASMAVWLGRLYDAVECLGVPAETVEQIRRSAGIPVFDGILTSGRGAAALAALAALPGSAALAALADSPADDPAANRRCVLQAVLVDLFR